MSKETHLSPADLAWLQRLPEAERLSADDVRQVRALRLGIERNGADPAARRKDLRLLDSVLAHADEILQRDRAPREAQRELALVEDLKMAHARSRPEAQVERLLRMSMPRKIRPIREEFERNLAGALLLPAESVAVRHEFERRVAEVEAAERERLLGRFKAERERRRADLREREQAARQVLAS